MASRPYSGGFTNIPRPQTVDDLSRGDAEKIGEPCCGDSDAATEAEMRELVCTDPVVDGCWLHLKCAGGLVDRDRGRDWCVIHGSIVNDPVPAFNVFRCLRN